MRRPKMSVLYNWRQCLDTNHFSRLTCFLFFNCLLQSCVFDGLFKRFKKENKSEQDGCDGCVVVKEIIGWFLFHTNLTHMVQVRKEIKYKIKNHLLVTKNCSELSFFFYWIGLVISTLKRVSSDFGSQRLSIRCEDL